MFESITTTMQSITDWSTLLVQLVVRGVIDLTNNSDLFCMLVDMLAILIHSTLIIDKEVGGSDRAEENKRSYLALVKKLKKEVSDRTGHSVRYIRQLLPIPKQFEEVITTEQYGLIPDGKGAKTRGFNCDKKQGLQVAEKQKVSPWDILEGHKNPAPLSWHWFQVGGGHVLLVDDCCEDIPTMLTSYLCVAGHQDRAEAAEVRGGLPEHEVHEEHDGEAEQLLPVRPPAA